MSTALMAPKKKRNTKGAAIAQAILEQYRPQTKEDMQEAIKDIFGPMFECSREKWIPTLAMKRMTTVIKIPITAEMDTYPKTEYSGQFYTVIPEVGNRRSDVKETVIPEPWKPWFLPL